MIFSISYIQKSITFSNVLLRSIHVVARCSSLISRLHDIRGATVLPFACSFSYVWALGGVGFFTPTQS